MQIQLLCVGKVRERYLTEGIAEYGKRLGRYCKLSVVEVADEKTPDGASAALEAQIRKKEGERLARHIREDAFRIALAIEGKQLDSVEFSRELSRIGLSGKGQIQFFIGGSLGLDEEITGRADLLLSFSRMTFPHQLMRLIFLEQLYRAFRIQKGEPYHK